MKCIILAGGKGSRLSEYTYKIPKPMVKIGGKPILDYIIKFYIKYGVKEFFIAAGYKVKVIKKYYNKTRFQNIKINVINTGLNTLTGKRIKKLKKYFSENENFYLTYGDGVSNVNIKKVYNLHKKKKSYFDTHSCSSTCKIW